MKGLRSHGCSQRPRFEQVVGYLGRNEPLPLDQPDHKATSFITSHFYLDDFVQSSEDPNPQPLQHTPLRAIPEEGFRTPAEDLARMRQRRGRPCRRPQGRRSDKQRSGPALHHRPFAQRGRRSAGSSGPRGRRSSRARGGAEYVRLNVMPRPGPQPQPPPQIIGRPDDIERRRGGAFGYLGGLAEGAAALSRRSGNSWVGRGTRRRRGLRSRARHGLGAGEHALPASAGQ